MASGSNVQGNLTEAGRLIDAAASAGAQVIVLPENFSHMGMAEEDKIVLAEVIGHGLLQEFISEQAKKYQIWIIAGTIPIKSMPRV